jgi:hypothetical protein
MFSNLLRFKQKKEAPIERAGGQRSSYPWTKLFIAAQHLKNTRREDIYCNFAELEGRIRCEWGRLARARGKFQGQIAPTIPKGTYFDTMVLSGSSIVSVGRLSVAECLVSN